MTLHRTHLQISSTDDAFPSVPVFFIVDYLAQVRRLLLDAKVGRCMLALDEVLRIVEREACGLETAYDSVIPAPSSLWSRLRGRYDIAYEMARMLARALGVPLRSAPFAQHWRVRKRALQEKDVAMRTGHDEIDADRHTQLDLKENVGHLLLIDDIATTGWTLTSLALPYLRQGYRVECLVFARAGSYLA